ncbi:hypothetical protein [Vibrio penaeicida]|uniref:hypothetical protein n=1 Tax=Vibrio penaeicida TaxID=104609 RepID=UPI000CEA2D1B|nr:hypothetical protein [Vibrio penaeicida]
MEKYDVAFSFTQKDAWIAKDLDILLQRLGVHCYCSAHLPDRANGQLRKELFNIYRSSKINVLIYSSDYALKANDSIVAMERKLLFDRHIGRGEESALFILVVDESSIPEEFDLCLAQYVKDIGILGAEKYIDSRLKEVIKVKGDNNHIYSHPTGIERIRGDMQPCTFKISPNWKNDRKKRWLTLGDISVTTEHSMSNGMITYLIPSGHCISFLGHSNRLRTDKTSLKIKKRAGLDFIRESEDKTFSGVIFTINHNGMDYPTVYCSEYDHYLNSKWENG